METVAKRLYESLFLVDSGDAASDWDGINKTIEKILTKADAEIVSVRKWDERRLAYEINKKARGTYILVYFNGDTAKISQIERDVQLSEQIMRVMILRTDKMTQKDIDKDTPAVKSEKEREASKAKEAKKADVAQKAKEAKEDSAKKKVEAQIKK